MFNTKDLLKNGYGLKVGYYVAPKFFVTLSYSINTFKENNKNIDTSNSVLVSSLKYTF